MSGVVPQDITNLCQERKISGFVCHDNCKSVAWCMNVGDRWETIITENCGENEYCSKVDGTCTTDSNVCSSTVDEAHFSCKTEGYFPDPFDCHRYYVCYRPPNNRQIVAIGINCPEGTAFNAAKADCSLTPMDVVCKNQQFQCNKPGEIHAWPNNNNIFYVCIKLNGALYPSLTRCEQGYVFKDGACVWDYVPNPSEEDPEKTTTTSTTTLKPETITCARPSRIEDTTDCTKYYYCSAANAQPIHYQCPQGSYYFKDHCVLGQCQNQMM